MSQEIKILQNNFETAYKEYKEYDNFLKSSAEEIKKSKEDFQKFAQENKENQELLTDKLFEVNEKPNFYAQDIIRLQQRLIHVYDFSKEVLEIPEEIRKEIDSLVKPQQIFKIEKGQAVEIDETHTQKLRDMAREHYKNILAQMK